MTRDPETMEPDEPIREAAVLMIHGGFRHLPLVQGEQVVGMPSIRDLIGWYSSTRRRAAPSRLLRVALRHARRAGRWPADWWAVRGEGAFCGGARLDPLRTDPLEVLGRPCRPASGRSRIRTTGRSSTPTRVRRRLSGSSVQRCGLRHRDTLLVLESASGQIGARRRCGAHRPCEPRVASFVSSALAPASGVWSPLVVESCYA